MISKITQDLMFYSCLCGMEGSIPIKDLRASEVGIRYGCEHCKRLSTAVCYDGPMPVDSGPAFERHSVNQTLYRRLVDAKQVEKDAKLRKTPLAKKWKKGGEEKASLHTKVIAQQRVAGTMKPKCKQSKEEIEKLEARVAEEVPKKKVEKQVLKETAEK